MGTFTMEFRKVIATLYGTTSNLNDYEQTYAEVDYKTIKYGKLPILPEYNSISLGYYPIFNEDYRKVLNGKIIDEYYLREIGTETIDNFLLILRKKMDQIMPFYNQLYESAEIPYDALDSMRIHSVGETHLSGTENAVANNKTDTKSDSGARVIGSNFPQTMLAGNGDYASTGNDTTSNSEVIAESDQTTDSSNNADTNSDNLVTGYQGAASDFIVKYRNSLINIDTMVLAEIEDCFMLLLNNGDEYTTRENPYIGWW